MTGLLGVVTGVAHQTDVGCGGVCTVLSICWSYLIVIRLMKLRSFAMLSFCCMCAIYWFHLCVCVVVEYEHKWMVHPHLLISIATFLRMHSTRNVWAIIQHCRIKQLTVSKALERPLCRTALVFTKWVNYVSHNSSCSGNCAVSRAKAGPLLSLLLCVNPQSCTLASGCVLVLQ